MVYPYSKSKYVNRIVDKIILVGNSFSSTDDTINKDESDDTGLLELYNNVVYPFIEEMINEAERYAGIGLGIQPKTLWTSRAGHEPGFHGPGMSYSFGGTDTIEEYNRHVAPCGALSTADIDFHDWYRGNLWVDLESIEGQNYSQIPYDLCDSDPPGDWEWPGLKKIEFGVWDAAGRERDHRYNKEYWAGIDCSGLVFRVVNHANANSSIRAKSTMPLDPAFRISAWTLYDPGEESIVASYYRGEDKTDIPNDIEYSQIRRGDILGNKTDPNHVVIFYSEKQTFDKEGDMVWQIIHAYGRLGNKERDNILGDGEQRFARKVVLSSNHLSLRGLSEPVVVGRITLWK